MLRKPAATPLTVSSRASLSAPKPKLNCPPKRIDGERLPPAELQKLHGVLIAAKLSDCCAEDRDESERRLGDLRRMYEPYVAALSDRLLMPVGAWVPAWARISADIETPFAEAEEKEHF